MSTITWLHLSDFHFRAEEQHVWNENIVLQALLEDVAKQIAQYDIRFDFIIATGDLAHSGQPEEYALAQEFLDDLLKTTKLDKDRLFLVPGNHDVDRGLITSGAQAIADALTDRAAANNVLSTSDVRKLIMCRFQGYAAFVNDYLKGLVSFDDEHYFYVRTLDLAGRQVALLGLNSAWLSASDEDKAKGLLIGEHQVRTSLERAKDADLKIAFLHHPFDWLREFDRNDNEAMLLDKCDFALHGHLHRTAATQLVSPDGAAMVLACGACYQTRDFPNRYNWVRLDLVTNTGDVHLQRYTDERGGFWARDTLAYKNVPDGVYSFALRSRWKDENHHRRLSPNPFTDVLAIRDPARFIGRRAVRRQLLTILERGSVALVGQRKIGKTSLLYRLEESLQKEPGQVVVFWDFLDPVDVTRLWAKVIRKLDADGETWEDLKRAIRRRRVVLLLDELDEAPERGFDLEALRRLRSLCQVERGLRLVTASRMLPREIYPKPAKGSWPYDFLVVRRLDRFEPDEARQLLAHPWTPHAPCFDEPTCRDMIKLSGCHPYWLQRAAHHCYEALVDSTYGWQAAYESDREALGE